MINFFINLNLKLVLKFENIMNLKFENISNTENIKNITCKECISNKM